MARYRTYTVEFKRQGVEEHLGGGTSLDQLARRHDISRELPRIWLRKYEAGAVANDGPTQADRRAYEAKRAGLERKVGQPTMELDPLKKGLISARRPRGATASVVSGPKPAAFGPGAARHEPGPEQLLPPAAAVAAEARAVARIREICAEFPSYGYRRVTAQLKADGERIDHERVARIMREQGLRVRPKRRFVVTTDSSHDGPIFPDLAKDLAPTAGPDRLWVADLTSIRLLSGFVYPPAVILDAWSRRVVGWALSRRIDAPTRRRPRRRRRSPPGNRRRAACATPIVAPGTPPSRTARGSRGMGSVARWAGAATLTTTPRRRAS